MNDKAILVIYGGGGHQEQMRRLLCADLIVKNDQMRLIAITDSQSPIQEMIEKNLHVKEFRDKHSNWKTIVKMPFVVLDIVFKTAHILTKYEIRGVITTGPGIAIIPCVLARILGKKIVVFESWSKFTKPSYTAKLLYRFAGLFIVQHKSMIKIFPKAKYWGKL